MKALQGNTVILTGAGGRLRRRGRGGEQLRQQLPPGSGRVSGPAAFINAHVMPVEGGLLAHTPNYAQTLAMGSAEPNTIEER